MFALEARLDEHAAGFGGRQVDQLKPGTGLADGINQRGNIGG